jgi:oligoendopeptidase F
MLFGSRHARSSLLSAIFLCAASTAAPQLSPTLYFPSAAVETSQRAVLHNIVPSIVRTLAAMPPSRLPEELPRIDDLLIALQNHAAYFKVLTLEDTNDKAARMGRDAVAADIALLEAAVSARLSRLKPSESGRLRRYAYLAQTARRDAGHALAPAAQAYRAAVVNPGLHGLADAYDRLAAQINRPDGTASLDTATRRAALAAWSGEYDQSAPEAAALLGTIIMLENHDAVAAGFRNAADRKYQELGLNEALVAQMLASVMAQVPAYRRYQEVLAQHAARTLDVGQVLFTEIDPAATREAPRSLDQARGLIATALQSLGPDYGQRFAALLDPANGRLDLDGGAHRARAATSIAAYGAPTALYYNGFDGSCATSASSPTRAPMRFTAN